MIYILVFFIAHWSLSLFFHSAFLHRYASHKMYTMSPNMEKVFYFLTWFFQGSSFLTPRPYAVMHRMHHAYSDTDKDPHSPHFFEDVVGMTKHTRRIYQGFLNGTLTPASEFCHDLPSWPLMDRIGNNIFARLCWGAVYASVYVALIMHFDLSWFWTLLLPIHYFMGPIQGSIVNWCGHKYGYQNFKNDDHSKNSEVWGFMLLGELFQNNHHKFPTSANFAQKWFELDPTFVMLRVLNWLKVIKLMPKPGVAVMKTAQPLMCLRSPKPFGLFVPVALDSVLYTKRLEQVAVV